jgi:PhoH-like ATPase
MSKKSSVSKRLFVLDTNVLMHDPTAIFRFKEHDIYLPMVVLEELDSAKKGLSEVARNVRQATRFLDDLLAQIERPEDINQGLSLPVTAKTSNGEVRGAQGRLFFQTQELEISLPEALPGQKPDNSILGTTMALQEVHPEHTVILVSKDINLRIKATVLGLHAEDYYNDKVLDDVDLLYSGSFALPENFWETHGEAMDSWSELGHTRRRRPF